MALGAINGYGKTKSDTFTTPNLKGLLVLEQKKKEVSKRRRKWRRWRCVNGSVKRVLGGYNSFGGVMEVIGGG